MRTGFAAATACFERGDHVELASAILGALGPHPMTFDAGEFWRYAPARGLWEIVPAHVVRSLAASFAGCRVGTGKEQRVLRVNASTARGAEEIARDRLRSAHDAVTFGGAPAGVAFRNGFVRVEAGRIVVMDHAPEHRARHGFPFDFERGQPTPLLDALLEDLFGGAGEREGAGRAALLQEFAGACLVGEATLYQRCLTLDDEHGSGRPALLKLLYGLFPEGAAASVPAQKWSDRSGVARLEGIRVNLVDETPGGELLDGTAFRVVVTGKPVTAHRKQHDAFDFTPVAGHLFSTCWPARALSPSAGSWRRPMILSLSRRLDDAPGRAIARAAVVLEQELPALAAWAIDGAARAQRQRAYTAIEPGAPGAAEQRDGAAQVWCFLSTRPGGEVIPAGELYKEYRTWTAARGHGSPVTNHSFGRQVMASGLYERSNKTTGRVYTRRDATRTREAPVG